MHKSLRALPWVWLLAAAAAEKPAPSSEADDLLAAAQQLFDEYAPEELKEHFEFPSKKEWDEFAIRLQQALESNDLRRLAAYEPEARAAQAALQALPEYREYADWLAERLDYIVVAKDAIRTAPAPKPKPAPLPPVTGPTKEFVPTPPKAVEIPHYDPWLARMRRRAAPPRAATLLPRVQAAFRAEGLPAELAWLAESESTFNPAALSPVGATGLFQLMPETAKSLGLQTFLPDERTHPEKSARAAARYLRHLHGRFGDWPLALAAYNAGEGRVGRLLAKHQAKTFAEIAESLPAETRMYVPKVLATIEVRAGRTPGMLPGPRT